MQIEWDTECQRWRKYVRNKKEKEHKIQRRKEWWGRQDDRQSERGRKQKSVALLGWMLTPVRDYWGEERGPYGCMAKWNPRGGIGHISLHGALHRFLCTAVCGTLRNIDNDIRLSHLCDSSWIPDDTAGKRPWGGTEKKKNICSNLQAISYLCYLVMTRARVQKQQRSWGEPEMEGMEAATAASLSLASFKTTEERVIIAPRFTPKAPLSLNQ